MNFTQLWKVKLSDWQRAFVVAILTTPFSIVYDWAMSTNGAINWRTIVKGAVAGGIGYLLKNILTGEKGNLLTNK